MEEAITWVVLNKYENGYMDISEQFPEGLSGDSYLPISIDGNELELRISPDMHSISFTLFPLGRHYARKWLLLHTNGLITEDGGVIPDFDRIGNEPVFTSSNEQIMDMILDMLRKYSLNRTAFFDATVDTIIKNTEAQKSMILDV